MDADTAQCLQLVFYYHGGHEENEGKRIGLFI
jgi:hypothetical protein